MQKSQIVKREEDESVKVRNYFIDDDLNRDWIKAIAKIRLAMGLKEQDQDLLRKEFGLLEPKEVIMEETDEIKTDEKLDKVTLAERLQKGWSDLNGVIQEMLGMKERSTDDKSQSLQDWLEKVRDAFEAQFPDTPVSSFPVPSGGWVRDIFTDYIIAEQGSLLYRVAFAVENDEIIFAPREMWVEVEKETEYHDKGKFVTIDGRPVFVGGPGQGAGGSGGSGSAVAEIDRQLRNYGSQAVYNQSTQSRILDEGGAEHIGTGPLGQDVYEAQGETFTLGQERDHIGRVSATANPIGISMVTKFDFLDDDDMVWPSDEMWKARLAKALKMQNTTAFSFKSIDGSTWWLQFTTNAFRDREAEIFTTKSLHDFVDRHRDNDTKGEFWYRHIPGTKFGTVRWQAMVGRFLVQAGPFDDTPAGHAFKAFFEQYPNGHPEIAPQGWGTSHGYRFDLKDRLTDGIYNWLEIKESTVLPSHLAANAWSPMPVIVNRSKEMNTQEQKELEAIGGQALVDMVTSQGETKTTELEQTEDFKAASPKAQVKTAIDSMPDGDVKKALLAALSSSDKDEKKELAPETKAKTKTVEPTEPIITRAEIAEAMKAIVEQFRTETAEASKATAQTVEASIANALEPLIESVKEMRKTDDERMAEKIEQTPAASLRDMVTSATQAKETKVRKNSPLVAQKPAEARPATQSGNPLPSFLQNLQQSGRQ